LADKFAKALPGTIYILDAYCLIQVASVIKSGVKPGVKPSQRRTVWSERLSLLFSACPWSRPAV